MKLYYVDVTAMNVNVLGVKMDPRLVEGKGEKYVAIALTCESPVGDGQMTMSQAEVSDLRDAFDKMFPRLSSIRGGKHGKDK